MNATQVYSDDDSASAGRYSDDFDSDRDKTTHKAKKTSTPKKIANHKYYQDKFSGRGRGSGGMKGHNQGHRIRRGRGYSEPADMRKSRDNVTSRVLSASRNRVNELRNKVEELNIRIRDLQQENKLYKKMQFRQEKAIRIFEETENDLPSILDRHNNEVRALRESNRALKEKFEKTDRYLRDAEDELERVKKKMNKYKEMCERKDLREREELSRKLTQAELDLEEKEAKLRELQRYIDLLKKNHKHELAIEGARQKEMKKQVEELTDKNSQLENQLKEKEKAMDYLNIYSNPQQGRASRDSSPNGSLAIRSTKKASARPELTPREKAKFYAEKRRIELLKQKDLKEEKERKKREQWEREEKEREMNKTSNTLSEFVFGSRDNGSEEREKKDRLDDEKRQRDTENRERQEEELQRKQRERAKREEQEIMDRKMQENARKELERKKKEEQDEWEKKEREKREQDEQEKKERKKREEKERREKAEQREEEERKRKENEMKEERERKEKEEQERKEREKAEEKRLQLEREKLTNDPLLQAERKKKDDLLKKLQAMDEVGSSSVDPFSPSSPLRKEKELSRISGIKDVFDSPSWRTEPKEYSFTKPINNLHQGKPSHEDVTVPYLERQRQKRRTSDDFGGYQPSFGPSKGEMNKAANVKPSSNFNDEDEPIFQIRNTTSSESTTKQDKKSNLLENLFGPQAKTAKNTSTKREEENYSFSSKNTSSLPKKQTSGALAATTTNSTTVHYTTSRAAHASKDLDKKSTVFGETALFDDDLSSTGGKILPLRHRQQNLNTFSAKPSVMAIDNIDDEIEEFVL